MDTTLYAVLTVATAGLIQSGFSLGTGMLSLLSGHSLSRRRSHARLLALTGAFTLGSFAMTLLLVLAGAYGALLSDATHHSLIELGTGLLAMLTGLWVTFFYHRRSRGSALWLPRPFARYLGERTAHTKNPAESFVLGGASVIYELPVTLALVLIAAVEASSVSTSVQLPVLALYAGLATSSLALHYVLVGGGHTHAGLTRFRARYKIFIQTVVGGSLLLLGAAVFWNEFFMVAGVGRW